MHVVPEIVRLLAGACPEGRHRVDRSFEIGAEKQPRKKCAAISRLNDCMSNGVASNRECP
jgi:hypothetical protein